MMIRTKLLMLLAALPALLLAGAIAVFAAKEGGESDGEVAIKLSDCPQAVRATIEREAQGGEIKEVEKETRQGKTAFEAEAAIGGKTYEIAVAEDGTLLRKVLEQNDDEDEGDDDEQEDGDADDDDADDKESDSREQ